MKVPLHTPRLLKGWDATLAIFLLFAIVGRH
jgi:hypothetical protein